MPLVPPPNSETAIDSRRDRPLRLSDKRLRKLRQRRQQQKRRVRLVIWITSFVLLFVAGAISATRQGVRGDANRNIGQLGESLRIPRQRHRANPFTENALADISPALRAFLDTIAFAEGTHDELGYRTLFTFDTFHSYRDHPRRVRCARYRGSRLCSDAAGRYQMLSSTFDSAAEAKNITDFSPKSQDLAAIELIRRRGALQKIETGDFRGAIVSLRSEWASLPGSGYGQPEVSLETLEQIYQRRLDYYRDRTFSAPQRLPEALDGRVN